MYYFFRFSGKPLNQRGYRYQTNIAQLMKF